MVRTKQKERTLRIILAALLDSELTLYDLREIANGLTHGDLSHELGFALGNLTTLFREGSPFQKEPFSQSAEELILSAVKRRKLSKESVIRSIMTVTGRSFTLSQGDTVRELLRRFLKNASPADISRFMSLIDPGNEDEYLRGITQRG